MQGSGKVFQPTTSRRFQYAGTQQPAWRLSAVNLERHVHWLPVGFGLGRGACIRPNAFNQDMKAFGCTQLASAFSDCVPPIPTSVLAITEKDTWQSIRLGTAADFYVLPRVKVTADAAYLPYVWFNGTDNHVLRSLVSLRTATGEACSLT